MKRFLFFIALLIAWGNMYAQTLSEKTTITNISPKNDWHTDKPVTGLNYMFPNHIYKYFIDSSHNELILVLRKKVNDKYKNEGWIATIYLNTDSIKWADEVHAFDIKLSKDNVIEKNDDTYYCYNLSDGQFVWKKEKLDLIYTDYESNTGFSRDIVATDLNTGKRKWKRKINTEYNWDDLQHIDDTTMILAAAGLHGINLDNGEGWDHKLKTGNKDYSKTVAMDVVGLTSAAIFGIGFYSVKPDIQDGMSSKLLVNSGRVYYASAESVICMDKQGDVIWETPTPGMATGASKICLTKNSVVLLNKGYRGPYYKTHGIDAPFIASYDKNTGRPIYLHPINNEGPVHDCYQYNDTLLISFKNILYKCDLISGLLQNSKPIDNTQNWKQVIIDPSQYYALNTDSTYMQLKNTGQYFVFDQKKINCFSSGLICVDTVSAKNIWSVYASGDGYNVIGNSSNTLLIKAGRPAAIFGPFDKILSAGKKLYMLHGNQLEALNLKQIL